MTKNEDRILDWRSTGRRIGRRVLYRERVTYKCTDCGRTSLEPPKDAPKYFDEIWPSENRVLDYPLQVDHLTKDYKINTVETLRWRCSPCHKRADAKTEKGESTIKKTYW